jgi:peptidoglycan/LPS O-acetylase OafA/YrhL
MFQAEGPEILPYIARITLSPLCAAFSIVYLDRAPEIVRRLLANSVLCWFGRCSFSLYLWQQLFYTYKLALGVHYLAVWMGPLAIGVGAMSFYVVENPIRLFLNRAWTARQQETRIEAVALVKSVS